MNDLMIQTLTNFQETFTKKESKIRLPFLDEFGDGKTDKDEIIKNLTFTCEEGLDYTKH